jgi:alanine racemase
LARAAVGANLGARLWGFGVSSVEEGVALRDAGVRERILLLGSLYPFESYDVVLERGLTPTVAGRASARALSSRAARRRRPAACHVKIDTGMGRIGLAPATARDVLPALAANPWLKRGGGLHPFGLCR